MLSAIKAQQTEDGQETIRLLEDFEQALTHALKQNDSGLVSENLQRLSEYIISENGVRHIPDICLRHECFPLFTRLRKAFSRAEAQVEKHTAAQMLNVGVVDIKSYFFMDDYQQLISQEVALLEETFGLGNEPTGDLMFLGAGALPVSAILFASRLGRRVVCVDLDAEACSLAAAVLEGMDLQHRIKIVCDDACTVPMDDASVIVIASLAQPKPAILERISRLHASPLVLMRSAHAHAAPLYEVIGEELFGQLGFDRLGATLAEGEVLHQTIALRRSNRTQTDAAHAG